MKLYADFSLPALVDASTLEWVASPAPGVDRLMLERDGEEVARCTSVVRYASNASFPAHTHTAGEEYLVLEGTFHDADGAHPAGTYVRNPPGSQHAPWTQADGCTLLVKLRHMDASDATACAVEASPDGADTDAASTRELYWNAATGERVLLQRVPAEQAVSGWEAEAAAGGEEVFVVAGAVRVGGGGQERRYGRWSWLRFPPAGAGVGGGGAERAAPPLVAAEACVLLRKVGHLARHL